MIMKNREKFENEIMDIACAGSNIAFDKETNKLTMCDGMSCSKCAFYLGDIACSNKVKEWCESEYEEPEVDWNKVPVDTPVLVRNNESDIWYNRHFAYFEDGKVFAYDFGATSWSADKSHICTSACRYAKLANEEDISKYAK